MSQNGHAEVELRLPAERRQQRNPSGSGEDAEPPCFEQPPLLWGREKFPRLRRGRAPFVDAPTGREGTQPATP